MVALDGIRRNGHRLARVAAVLAWVRLGGVLIAVTATATAFGSGAVIGGFETFGAAVAVFDVFLGLFITRLAVRHTGYA